MTPKKPTLKERMVELETRLEVIEKKRRLKARCPNCRCTLYISHTQQEEYGEVTGHQHPVYVNGKPGW